MTKKLIKFYADWCNPCKTLTGMIAGIDSDLKENGIDYEEADADEFGDRMTAFGLRGLPALVLVSVDTEGNETMIKKHAGLISKNDLLTWTLNDTTE